MLYRIGWRGGRHWHLLEIVQLRRHLFHCLLPQGKRLLAGSEFNTVYLGSQQVCNISCNFVLVQWYMLWLMVQHSTMPHYINNVSSSYNGRCTVRAFPEKRCISDRSVLREKTVLFRTVLWHCSTFRSVLSPFCKIQNANAVKTPYSNRCTKKGGCHGCVISSSIRPGQSKNMCFRVLLNTVHA